MGKTDENVTRREAREGFYPAVAALWHRPSRTALHTVRLSRAAQSRPSFYQGGLQTQRRTFIFEQQLSCKFTPWSTVTPFRTCKVYKGAWLLLPFIKGTNCLCTSSFQSSATATRTPPQLHVLQRRTKAAQHTCTFYPVLQGKSFQLIISLDK